MGRLILHRHVHADPAWVGLFDPSEPSKRILKRLEKLGFEQDPDDGIWYRTLESLGRKNMSCKAIAAMIRQVLDFLRKHLPKALGLKPQQVEVLHGGLSNKEQQRIVEDFGRDTASVRLLLAGGVASEGINLHHNSHRLIHFDVPWSLMVFQQRNGRPAVPGGPGGVRAGRASRSRGTRRARRSGGHQEQASARGTDRVVFARRCVA